MHELLWGNEPIVLLELADTSATGEGPKRDFSLARHNATTSSQRSWNIGNRSWTISDQINLLAKISLKCSEYNYTQPVNLSVISEMDIRIFGVAEPKYFIIDGCT